MTCRFESPGRTLLLAGLSCCLLGIAQFFSPPEAFINRYAWSNPSMGVAGLGLNKTRITGTFSYIAPYAVYLQFVFLAGLALFKLSGRGRSRILLGAGTALVFVNIVMTGSRPLFCFRRCWPSLFF